MPSTDPKRGVEFRKVKGHCSLQLQTSLLLRYSFPKEPAYLQPSSRTPNPFPSRISEVTSPVTRLHNCKTTQLSPVLGACGPSRGGPRQPGGSTEPSGLRPPQPVSTEDRGRVVKTRPLPLDRTQFRAATETAKPQDPGREEPAEETTAARRRHRGDRRRTRRLRSPRSSRRPHAPATLWLAVLLPCS